MSAFHPLRKVLLWPLGALYGQVMAVRNQLYDRGTLPSYGFDIPIVSIGNLTMGGTGKTPILGELVKWSQERGLRAAIVSRGYRGRVKTWAKVVLDGDSREYGDEPMMMARRFPQVPVYVGADRVAVIHELLAREPGVQVIFTDDTFQHRRLKRRLDIVVLDCTEAPENYEVVPLGRGREWSEGLNRADFVILNKVNLVEPATKQKMLAFIDRIGGDRDKPIIECEYHVRRLVRLDGAEEAALKGYEKIALVSGIGRPETFDRLLGRNFEVRKHFVFRDHYDYQPTDVAKLLAESAGLKVQRLVTTEKDAIKLRRFAELSDKIWVAELAPKLSLRVKSLYEKILAEIH